MALGFRGLRVYAKRLETGDHPSQKHAKMPRAHSPSKGLVTNSFIVRSAKGSRV